MAEKIKLYSVATLNGKKIGIAMEEMELPYEPIFINFKENEQKSEWFTKINPNGRIPAIVDSKGPHGKEVTVFETGAILQYLGEKSGKFLPEEHKWEIISWIYFFNTGVAPVLGNLGFFTPPQWKKEQPEEEAVKRFTNEANRVFGIIDKHFQNSEYFSGNQYTIADINAFPWLEAVLINNPARLSDFPHIVKYIERISQRPAVQRGSLVNASKS